MVNVAELTRDETEATLQAELVQAYFALALTERIVEVRKMACTSLRTHYEQALKLEANGMINKAERLVAQVGMEEAQREWESAQKERTLARNALNTLLGISTDTSEVCPVTPLFITPDIPDVAYFKSLTSSGNYTLDKLRLQEDMAENGRKIARSAYLPDIALFAGQTLYAHNLPRNLMPRTLVGVGFTWNLFDGLNREADIRSAKLTRQSVALGREKAEDELNVMVEKLYTEMRDAQDGYATLGTTLEMSRELLRIRRKSFLEGMATSTEVVDAEVMLSKVEVARLMVAYQFDVSLASLCSVCGMPELFWKYIK